MGPGSAQVTPEEIISLILEEMRAEVAPMYYSNLVRTVYHVYLYGEDLERLRPVFSRIREETTRALDEELAKLNKRKKSGLGLLKTAKRHKTYETLGDWTIDFHENTDEDARENPLIIHSAFAAAEESEERVGTLTERVTRRRFDGQLTTSHRAQAKSQEAIGQLWATIEYEDDRGAQTYRITKDRIKIGRGSADRWVDLKLNTKKDVSREHLQLRRETSTGQFFIKDLSTLGTTVNGKPVPPSIETVNGETIDKQMEIPLPNKARIGLAGVVFLDFKAVGRK